jgi:hypothetical protein
VRSRWTLRRFGCLRMTWPPLGRRHVIALAWLSSVVVLSSIFGQTRPRLALRLPVCRQGLIRFSSGKRLQNTPPPALRQRDSAVF